MWYTGFWVMWYDGPYGRETDSGGARDFFNSEYAAKYSGLGTSVMIMLFIAAIMMFISSRKATVGRENKVAIATSAIGTALAFLGPGIYYGYLDREFTNFWLAFDQGIGFYLPIIAGILGIIATSFNIYAFTLEPKVGEERVIEKYQPPPDKQVEVQVQQEGLKFCPNCGAKLTGPFCQECGTKVY